MTLKIFLYIEVADSQPSYVQDMFSCIISKLLELRKNLKLGWAVKHQCLPIVPGPNFLFVRNLCEQQLSIFFDFDQTRTFAPEAFEIRSAVR